MDYKFPILKEQILELIPQREPFLFVDTITAATSKSIDTTLKLTGEEDFFKGHFPGNPIMPGVLLQEAVFQSGAAMISLMSETMGQGVGVVARVKNAKFKNFVKPGDTLKMNVSLDDVVGNAYYMKGKSFVSGKLVMSIDFTCAIVKG